MEIVLRTIFVFFCELHVFTAHRYKHIYTSIGISYCIVLIGKLMKLMD